MDVCPTILKSIESGDYGESAGLLQDLAADVVRVTAAKARRETLEECLKIAMVHTHHIPIQNTLAQLLREAA